MANNFKQNAVTLYSKIKPILVLISIFSLYVFLFNDFFNLYGTDAASWYAVCATFLTLSFYGKSNK